MPPHRDAFARFVNYDPHPLTFSIRPDQLINEGICKKLMRDIDTAAQTPWEMVVATSRAGSQIPNKPGIYAFVWRPMFYFQGDDGKATHLRQVLYVGKAGDDSDNTLRKRYQGEYKKYISNSIDIHWEVAPSKSDRAGLLRRYLTLWKLEFWYCVFHDEQGISELESRLVRALDPPVNTQLKKPRATLGHSSKAF